MVIILEAILIISITLLLLFQKTSLFFYNRKPRRVELRFTLLSFCFWQKDKHSLLKRKKRLQIIPVIKSGLYLFRKSEIRLSSDDSEQSSLNDETNEKNKISENDNFIRFDFRFYNLIISLFILLYYSLKRKVKKYI